MGSGSASVGSVGNAGFEAVNRSLGSVDLNASDFSSDWSASASGRRADSRGGSYSYSYSYAPDAYEGAASGRGLTGSASASARPAAADPFGTVVPVAPGLPVPMGAAPESRPDSISDAGGVQSPGAAAPTAPSAPATAPAASQPAAPPAAAEVEGPSKFARILSKIGLGVLIGLATITALGALLTGLALGGVITAVPIAMIVFIASLGVGAGGLLGAGALWAFGRGH